MREVADRERLTSDQREDMRKKTGVVYTQRTLVSSQRDYIDDIENVRFSEYEDYGDVV